MYILGLDVSTNTGYCILDCPDKGEPTILSRGALPKVTKPKNFYPKDFVDWAEKNASGITALEARVPSNGREIVVVLEETSKGSKNAMSQKILEWTHFLLAKHFLESLELGRISRLRYMMTGEWRNKVGCVMTKEEKAQNKFVSKSSDKVVKDPTTNKRIGKVGKKHVNVRRANEIFSLNLKLKDNDQADAILLSYACYLSMLEDSK